MIGGRKLKPQKARGLILDFSLLCYSLCTIAQVSFINLTQTRVTREEQTSTEELLLQTRLGGKSVENFFINDWWGRRAQFLVHDTTSGKWSWWLDSVSGSGWADPNTACIAGHLQKDMKSSVSFYTIPKLFTDIFNGIFLFYPWLNSISPQLSRFCNVSDACFFFGWLRTSSILLIPPVVAILIILHLHSCSDSPSFIFDYVIHLSHMTKHWCFLQVALNNDEWLAEIWKIKTSLHVPEIPTDYHKSLPPKPQIPNLEI